jgi:hypothetical protein
MTKLIVALIVAGVAALPHFGSGGVRSPASVQGGIQCTGITAWHDCSGVFCGGYNEYFATEQDTVVTEAPSTHVCSGTGWCESRFDQTGKPGCL